MKKWTTNDIPSLTGKTAIVTGTGGLGLEDALALARAGAAVIIAGRSREKGAAAVAMIRTQAPTATVQFELLDLADLASVRDFSARISRKLDRLDILINNAGVMTPPVRKTTKQDFELQFGTNYLGHFALTAQLLPLLKKAKGRVVMLSSIAARRGAINLDDLQAKNSYTPMPVYAQSKLACLMFTFELQKQSDAAGWGITSIAAHPGLSRTELIPNGSGSTSPAGRMRAIAGFLLQPAAQGALPTLYAATSPEAVGSHYYGPNRLNETRGYPTAARVPAQANDDDMSAKLWKLSETLSAVRFG